MRIAKGMECRPLRFGEAVPRARQPGADVLRCRRPHVGRRLAHLPPLEPARGSSTTSSSSFPTRTAMAKPIAASCSPTSCTTHRLRVLQRRRHRRLPAGDPLPQGHRRRRQGRSHDPPPERHRLRGHALRRQQLRLRSRRQHVFLGRHLPLHQHRDPLGRAAAHEGPHALPVQPPHARGSTSTSSSARTRTASSSILGPPLRHRRHERPRLLRRLSQGRHAPRALQEAGPSRRGFGRISGSHFPAGEPRQSAHLQHHRLSRHPAAPGDDHGADIHSMEVEPIVVSSDRNFRPVDVEIGADGAIYFLDWHNAIIGHMQHNLRDPSRDNTPTAASIASPPRDAPLLEAGSRLSGKPIAELRLASWSHPRTRCATASALELSGRDTDQVLAEARRWVGSSR